MVYRVKLNNNNNNNKPDDDIQNVKKQKEKKNRNTKIPENEKKNFVAMLFFHFLSKKISFHSTRMKRKQ